MVPECGPADLFRGESATLKSRSMMEVIDQFSRRITGLAVHTGDGDSVAYCRMFNLITAGSSMPKYLSSDNDPLFLFHRFKSNLHILEISELKPAPSTPTSHSFIARVIGTTSSEYLDQLYCLNVVDLLPKLDGFQEYYHYHRGPVDRA